MISTYHNHQSNLRSPLPISYIVYRISYIPRFLIFIPMKLLAFLFSLILLSCSTTHKINRLAKGTVLKDSTIGQAHIGIAVYDPEQNKWLYNNQGDQYFVPASNTKLPTCYAAMKYLGDSLPGLRYSILNDTMISLIPTGDPSFLQEDFKHHPVLDFLQKQKAHLYLSNKNWRDAALGSGWSWNDYNSSYMAERSSFPVYGNIVKIKTKEVGYEELSNRRQGLKITWDATPSYFSGFAS
jgi:D-alanyl-D-alanine carboxypeptidase/D-alanyl-D-alanine-endopeptidase (penicillin-binding protein 4)